MLRNKNIHTFMGFDTDYDDADLIVFGAPYDSTTSFRPGSRFAPEAIRQDSYGLETYSPYLDANLEDFKICDVGDLPFQAGRPEKYLDTIEQYVSGIIKSNKKPFMIGGEHLVTLPSFKAVAEKYPDLYILHFDAHTDLRDTYLDEKLSHATVIRRCWDIIGDNRIFQFGIRSGEKTEFEWAKEHTSLTKFTTEGLKEAVKKIGNSPVYITIDLDILDPSIFSGTGTPEPGGISFQTLMDAIASFLPLQIVGADVVELSPHYDQSGVSTAVACKIIRELAIAMNL